MAASPSTISVVKISSRPVQDRQVTEAFSSGVTFRGSPPPAGITKRSPPGAIKSLMSPPMKAMLLPSGDHLGEAICNFGLRIENVFPEPTSRRYSSAVHQLSPPCPLASLQQGAAVMA